MTDETDDEIGRGEDRDASPNEPGESHLAKLNTIVKAAVERSAHDPVLMNVGGLTSYADTLVVMHGNSARQVRAISSHIVKALKAHDEGPLGVEGGDTASWILIDANDTIIHIFDPEARELFDLEGLWGDAPRIELELPDGGAETDVEVNEEAQDQVLHPAN